MQASALLGPGMPRVDASVLSRWRVAARRSATVWLHGSIRADSDKQPTPFAAAPTLNRLRALAGWQQDRMLHQSAAPSAACS